MSTRIEGIVDKVSDAEKFSTVEWVLGKGPITNFVQSTVDSKIKANLDFQGKAGLPAKVVRKSRGYCCEWCNNLIGEYEYPDVPPDVYRRHDNCNCIVTYYPGDGRAQNVHTKAWEVEDPETLEARKNFVGIDTAPQTIREHVRIEEALITRKVQKVPIENTGKALTSEEAVEKVAGGDLTKGSCVSVAQAYIGNRGGYNVLDYRGGASQEIFCNPLNITSIAEIPGVECEKLWHLNDFTGVHKLLKGAEAGKEYFLVTGRHGAIVRKTGKEWEYLELQSDDNKGWHKLTDYELRHRFGCQKSHTAGGVQIGDTNLLFDCETMYNNQEYINLLEYINTAEDKQLKGVRGYAK